jgi:hypothetical protein
LFAVGGGPYARPMLALVDAVARYVLAADQPTLWSIKVRGRAVGLFVREGGAGRLSWFAGADRRLVNYAGPLDGEDAAETLAAAFSARLGMQVELESLPG